MNAEMYVIALVVALAALYFTVPVVAGAFIKYRGTRVITCPETRRPAAVEVDVTRAALTAAIRQPDVRLRSCTRWPRRQDCGQECLLQIEVAPEDCRVRNILGAWYAGKACAKCAKPFEEIQWSDHKPGLLAADGRTWRWDEIRPESVPDALSTQKPICWDCEATSRLTREHADWVFKRPAHNTEIVS